MNFLLAYESLPALFYGALISLAIATISCLIGLLLGVFLVVLDTRGSSAVRWAVLAFTTIIKGTPMLIQIFIAFYVLPQMGIFLPAFWTAALAIGINSGVYISTIIHSGITAVGTGQMEAAKVLGFTDWQAIWYILAPQTVRIILPTLGNEFITLIKDSSLASTIGVVELLKSGWIIRSRTYDAVTVFVLVALFYLVLTSMVTFLVSCIAKRMHISHVNHS